MKKITLLMLAVCLFLAGSTFAQTTILSEDFESVSAPALPAGWTTATLGTDAGFTTGTSADANSGGYWAVADHGTFAMTNDDACDCDKSADYLTFPSMDLTGESGAQLSFVYIDDRTYGGNGGSVEMNVDGGGWNNIGTFSQTTVDAWTEFSAVLTGSDNASDVRIRIKYDDGGEYATGIAVDDIMVFSPADIDIGVESISMLNYALISSGAQSVTGVITNFGLQTITSVDVTWTVDGGAGNTESLTGLSIAPLTSYTFVHGTTWTPPSTGVYSMEIATSNPNGTADMNGTNDNDALEIGVMNTLVPKIPLFENFTSSTCPPCTPANAQMLSLLGKDPFSGLNANKWALVKYQMSWPSTGDPYYTLEGGTRRTYYGINSVPRIEIDGGWDDNGNNLTQAIIDDYNTPISFLDINSTFTVTGQTVAVDITIDALASMSFLASSNLVMHVAIVENETFQNVKTNGETEFQFVMKKMVPDASGTPVGPLTAGTPVNISDGYTFNGSYVLPPDANSPANLTVEHTVEGFDDLSVVVWVQDASTKEVFQSAWAVYTCGVASASSVNASCGASDGSATATTTGGGDLYLWDDPSAQTTDTATNLAAGIYNVTITDAIGCEVTTSVAVNNSGGATVTSQAIPTSCSDGATGIINLTVSSGSSPYTYIWSNGETTENITGLATGDYMVTVTDSAGCMSFETATITAPDAIVATSSITSSSGSDGAIDLTVSGGTPLYTYDWDNGATTEDITGLAAGTYMVTITDGFSCTITESYTVQSITGTGIADVEGLTELSVYPNPFNSFTTVEFTLLDKENVVVDVMSVVGELVYAEDHGTLESGSHKIQISGESLAPGIYFVKIQIGGRSITRKVIHN